MVTLQRVVYRVRPASLSVLTNKAGNDSQMIHRQNRVAVHPEIVDGW